MSDQQSAAPAAPAAPPAPTPPSEQPTVSKKKEIGKVKWFNSSKGFGFITAGSRDGAGEEVDVFVHQTAIHAQGFRSLQQGEEVEYVAEEGDDGRLRAVEVTGPSGSYVQGATRYGSRGGSRGAKAGAGGSAAPPPSREPQQQQQQQRQQTFQFGGVCYNCGIVGHMSRDCQSPGGYYPPPPTIRGRGRGRGGPSPLRQYPDTRTCYSCGVVGHLQRDCPNFVPS